MRSFLAIAALAILCSLPALLHIKHPSASDNWSVGDSWSDDLVYRVTTIDVSNISTVNKMRRAWVTTYDYGDSKYVDMQEFDCAQRRMRTLQSTIYAGQLNYTGQSNGEWTYAIPRTLGERSVLLVCADDDQQRSHSGAVPIKGSPQRWASAAFKSSLDAHLAKVLGPAPP